jgi:hypothetical protein
MIKNSPIPSKGYFHKAVRVIRDKEMKLITNPKQVSAKYFVARISPLEIGLLISVNIVLDFNSSAMRGAPTTVRIIGNIIQGVYSTYVIPIKLSNVSSVDMKLEGTIRRTKRGKRLMRIIEILTFGIVNISLNNVFLKRTIEGVFNLLNNPDSSLLIILSLLKNADTSKFSLGDISLIILLINNF